MTRHFKPKSKTLMVVINLFFLLHFSILIKQKNNGIQYKKDIMSKKPKSKAIKKKNKRPVNTKENKDEFKKNRNKIDLKIEIDKNNQIEKISNKQVSGKSPVRREWVPSDMCFLPDNLFQNGPMMGSSFDKTYSFKSKDISVVYPKNNFMIADQLIGLTFKSVGKNFEYFLVFKSFCNFKIYFVSLYVRFSHYSDFEKEYQNSRFFDRLLYSDPNKVMRENQSKISKFNKILQKNNVEFRSKFVVYKVPLSHWTHPENMNSRSSLEQKTKAFIRNLKKIMISKKRTKEIKIKKERIAQIMKNQYDINESYDASGESSSLKSYISRKKKKKPEAQAQIIGQVKKRKRRNYLEDEREEIKNQDSKSILTTESRNIVVTSTQKNPSIRVDKASEESKNPKIKVVITNLDNNLESQYLNLPNQPNENKSLNSEYSIQNESKNKTEQISESSRSGFLILQAESDTSINIQKRMSTIDSDEDEQIEPNTSFSKKKILQDLPKKKEKDTEDVRMIDVMNIFNTELDEDFFKIQKSWEIKSNIMIRVVHKGEYSFTNHVLMFCFDSDFKTFLLIFKDINFENHTKEVAEFKAHFKEYIVEYALHNKLDSVTIKNSFEKIQFIKRYRYKNNPQFLVVILFIPGFHKVFYLEMDLYNCLMSKKHLLDLSSFRVKDKSFDFSKIELKQDKYLLFLFSYEFLLIPINYFLSHIENLNFKKFYFKLPFKIYDVFYFSNGLLGLIHFDSRLQDEIFEFDFVRNQKEYTQMIGESKTDKVKNRERFLQKKLREFTYKIDKINRSNLKMFSLKFNKLTYDVEKFNFIYSVDLKECFTNERELILMYLHYQYRFVSNMRYLLSFNNDNWKTDYNREQNWKEQIRNAITNIYFFATKDKFFCVYGKRHFKTKNEQIDFDRTMRSSEMF